MRNLELEIDDVAFGGKGVARDEQGKAVFVPFTIDGERIRARIVREKKKFAEAEALARLTVSPHRVEPPCPYFARCGGCSYQHIKYEHQLTLKTRQVEQTLRRLGHFTELSMQPIVASPSYGYRNRITVHADNGVVGFFRHDEHQLIDIEHCLIATPEVNEQLRQLRERRPRDGHYTLRAHTGPRVFTQTNDTIAEALATYLRGLIGEGGELLIDACCGAGFFAKRLLDRFQRIIGIDRDRFAIQAARADAAAKETYIAGDIEAELDRFSRNGDLRVADRTVWQPGGRRSLVLIVDPPATGLSTGVRRAMAELAPQTLIYVSCNPATLARDLGELRSRFTIASIRPFDMFPQTAEIEVVAHLRSIPSSPDCP
jgi:23S rRNA (uracil1939-C5)-methyltransferase